MRMPQGFEWLIIGAIILLLFGAKRMPDAARGLGRSLRIFKAETKNLTDSDDDETTPVVAAPAGAVTTPVTAPVMVPVTVPVVVEPVAHRVEN